MKTGIICVLAVAVMAGCGRAGSQGPEAPAPDDEVATDGFQSRTQALGAVTTYIPTEAQARVARLGDMLIGRVPGLEVRRLASGGYTLRIRGPRTLMGSVADEEPTSCWTARRCQRVCSALRSTLSPRTTSPGSTSCGMPAPRVSTASEAQTA